MNKGAVIKYYFLFFVICSCCPKDLSQGHNANKYNEEVVANRLPERYYLKNRIDNCEDRIKYMQSIVTYPEDSDKELKFYSTKKGAVLGIYTSYISTDVDKGSTQRDLKYFYFDLSCFEGQHYSSLLPVLLSPTQYNQVDELLKSIPDNHFRFEALIYGIHYFGFAIRNNKVIHLSEYKKSNIPGFKIYDN